MNATASWIAYENRSSAGAMAHAPWASLLRRVSLWVERRAAWLASAARESQAAACVFGDREPEERFYDESLAVRGIERELAAIICGEGEARLQGIASAMGLSEAERDALALCVALALEPRLGAAFARLREDPAQVQVSEVLVAELTRRPMPLLSSAGGLLGWSLLRRAEAEGGLPASLTIDPYIFDVACGSDRGDPELAPYVTPVALVAPLPAWPVAEAAARVRRALEPGRGRARREPRHHLARRAHDAAHVRPGRHRPRAGQAADGYRAL